MIFKLCNIFVTKFNFQVSSPSHLSYIWSQKIVSFFIWGYTNPFCGNQLTSGRAVYHWQKFGSYPKPTRHGKESFSKSMVHSCSFSTGGSKSTLPLMVRQNLNFNSKICYMCEVHNHCFRTVVLNLYCSMDNWKSNKFPRTPKLSKCTIGGPLNTCQRGLKR